jgi:hypothetical protein
MAYSCQQVRANRIYRIFDNIGSTGHAAGGRDASANYETMLYDVDRKVGAQEPLPKLLAVTKPIISETGEL